MLLSSEQFLQFHDCPNVDALASLLLSNPRILGFIHRSSFSSPNYGPLWFRCKEEWTYSSKEILLLSARRSALSIASNAGFYYDAMLRSAQKCSGVCCGCDA